MVITSMERDVLAHGTSVARRELDHAHRSTAIITRMKLAAPLDEAWRRLMFYEQIAERPPFLLRLLLPIPIESVGRKSKVGDEVQCLYERGSLRKRVTAVDHERRYEFDVVEQDLALGGGMKLIGGSYEMRRLADGSTEVALETRYVSPKRPRWLWKHIEAAVCHAFHRHILRSMRSALDVRAEVESPRAREAVL
jgi:hypothetical protein